MTLGDVQTQSRHNNVNFIRLVAATAVTFGHCFALLGQVPSWNNFVNSTLFGFVAVAIFFGLSGFLISQSFENRTSWVQFIKARWLRIFPGLFFAAFVTTILVSQFVKHQGFDAFLDIKNWRYTFGAFFFDMPYFTGVFEGLPNSSVNGSLWTISIEFRMYLFVLTFGLLGLLKRRALFLTMAAVLLLCGTLHLPFVTNKIFHILFDIRDEGRLYISLPFCFVFGMLAYLFREKFILNIYMAALLLFANVFVSDWVLQCISFVYAAFVFGYHPGLYLPKLNFKTDISYGIYVLSFPIQQTLIFNKIVFEPYLFFVVVMLVVVPVALFSWTFIEKPALRLKKNLWLERRLAMKPFVAPLRRRKVAS